MKRLITILSALSIALISCQQNLVPDQQEITASADEVMTRTYSTGKVTPDDPVIFLPATNTKAWTDIESLEDRFEACRVSETRLSNMTTEALVKSMMNYPMNFLVLAYSNPQDALNLIIKHSPLHQEFLSRNDAAEVFVNLYAETEVDMRVDKGCFDGDYVNLSYVNTMFMDYFLASKHMTGLDNDSVKQKLSEAVARKLQERLQDCDTFSQKSIIPLLNINDVESLGISSTSQITPRSLGAQTTVVTIYEQIIDAFDYSNSEMTSIEMEIITNFYVSQFPNAIVRGASTRKYNSHSYAWYDSSLNNKRWIEYYDHSGNPQLQKFWTNDAFVECTESEAEVIFYTDFQHSAVKLPNGNYLSKWHEGPLMEHAPTYGPYSSSNRRYFKFNFTPKTGGITISGTTSVSLDQPYFYNIVNPRDYLTYSWEIRFMDAPEPKPFWASVDESRGRFCHLEFQDYGLFKIKVTAYNRGYQVRTGQLDVLALPPM